MVATRTAGHRGGVGGARRVTAVVPVKPLAEAKSRLAVPASTRRELVLGFAEDTIAAVLGSPLVGAVVVVTADPAVAERVRRPGVHLVDDDREGDGLDGAVALGVRAAHPAGGVLVVPADLPCLRPRDVTQLLAGAPAAAAFVPDRAGTGTTVLVLPPGAGPLSRYGTGSARRHRLLGLQPLWDAPVRARHDVDTLEDLAAARALGVGRRTQAALTAAEVACS